ncbi:MAG: NAD(P)/FAD-dependent oxidoreductase [Alphaproteobacteria bacterium]
MQACDFLIIGAGMAGTAAGYFLRQHGRVVVLERESQPGYHTTGRSAAFYARSYGNEHVRPLILASADFEHTPPAGFADAPILNKRGALYVAREDQRASLQAFHERLVTLTPDVTLIDADDVLARCSALRADYVVGGLVDDGCFDIDVDVLHQGYLRGIRQAGSEIITGAEVTSLARRNGCWEAETTAGAFKTSIVINAAGAWADPVAQLAGLEPLGIQPLRRTVIILPQPPVFDAGWPLVLDVDDQFYFKPEAGKILASPGDETPTPPTDAQPEEIDIAITVDRLEKATTIPAPRIESSWAGLRSFAHDRTPVVGFDPGAPGFFWFAGQGGYGIKTSPAMGRMAESLIVENRMPEELDPFPVTAATYGPERLR